MFNQLRATSTYTFFNWGKLLHQGAPFNSNPWNRLHFYESHQLSSIRKFFQNFNPYRWKRPKVDARIFDSALSHTRRSKAREKKEENSVFTFGRFCLWTSFESSPVSVNTWFFRHFSLKNWQNFQTLRLRVTIKK